MERIAMSQQERDWLEWLKRAQDGVVTQRLAAEKMGVTDRWVRSLLAEMKVKGDAIVIHGLRGRPSNRRIDEDVRARSMKILKSPDWHDCKPRSRLSSWPSGIRSKSVRRRFGSGLFPQEC